MVHLENKQSFLPEVLLLDLIVPHIILRNKKLVALYNAMCEAPSEDQIYYNSNSL